MHLTIVTDKIEEWPLLRTIAKCKRRKRPARANDVATLFMTRKQHGIKLKNT